MDSSTKHTCKERHHGNLKGWVQNCDDGPKHMDEGEDDNGWKRFIWKSMPTLRNHPKDVPMHILPASSGNLKL